MSSLPFFWVLLRWIILARLDFGIFLRWEREREEWVVCMLPLVGVANFKTVQHNFFD